MARRSITRIASLPTLVSAPKTSFAYQAHSYPTKVPPEAIVPFIEACTEPGDLVMDPFCGSGMTGVATLMTGRRAVLSDLSPGAVHVAKGHTQGVPGGALTETLANFDANWMGCREEALYGARCPTCGSAGIARHTIWSETLRCLHCEAETVLFDHASDLGQIPRSVPCSSCGNKITRAGAVAHGSIPVQITVECGGECRTLQTGPVDREGALRVEEAGRRRRRYWVPSNPVESDREMYKRSALHLKGIEKVADFYLPRAKLALSELWDRISRIENPEMRHAFRFAFTNTAWHSSRMRRYNARGGQRPLTGTLYIPQLVAEANVFEVFRNQTRQLIRYYDRLGTTDSQPVDTQVGTATGLTWLEDNSVDYVFTDPPFGANLFYADCNLVWEAWLGEVTDSRKEIVVNRSRQPSEGGKTVSEYGDLLSASFSEIRRVLKPGGLASVVFHNSDDAVWTAMLGAAESAGLVQQHVGLLDKVQRSMKGYKGRSGRERVPFYDLVITFGSTDPRNRLNGAGTVALQTIRSHLSRLDTAGVNGEHDHRSLEYLYSYAVAETLRRGVQPEGLSFRAFESLCDQNFRRVGRMYWT